MYAIVSRPMLAAACLGLILAGGASAEDPPGVWAPFVETDIIEIHTQDEDGDSRETKIWIVVLDGAGWVRTNDSRWLANIRRGSPIELRADDTRLAATATEIEDEGSYDRVEAAFKEKYGAMQKIMSFFRLRRPTVLRLDAQA